MGRGRALLKCNIAIAGQYREYGYDKVSGWINNLGGSATRTVTKATTHVVATEKAWKRKDAAVATAQQLNEQGGVEIKIVSFDWLEDSVNNKTKKREGPYLWTKLDGTVAKQEAARARQEKAKKAKSHVGMMAEVLQEGTEQYVDPRQEKSTTKQIEREERARKQLEEEEKAEKREEEIKKKAEAFKHGAKKARNDIFTENHHIYTDETGFKFDVVLTKVDTRHNRNERWAITIYESNAEPHTYACNLQFAGTKTRPSNNIIVAIGSPFAPAYYKFKKSFKEKTRVKWEDRIEHAIERTKKERRERGQATGSEDQGSRKGVAVSTQEQKEEQERKAEKEFKSLPFEYHPPRFGPRGKLPKEKEVPAELIPAPNTDIEYCMSGGNGAGPDAPIDLTEQEVEVDTRGSNDLHESIANADNTNNDNSDSTPVNANDVDSMFDEAVKEWLDKNLDEHYPFDHTVENMEYLAQSNGQEIGVQLPPSDTFDTAVTNTSEPLAGDRLSSQQDVFFNHINTDVTEPPISFNLPSTVEESFEPGTLDMSDTQMADRFQDDFLELTGLPDFTDGADMPQDGTGEADSLVGAAGLDLGSSILGKRKTPPDGLPSEALKSPKYGDEDEAFTFAAEQSFEGEQDYQQFTSEIAGLGGDETVPRAMIGEHSLGSIDQAAEVDEGVDFEGDNGMVEVDDELPSAA